VAVQLFLDANVYLSFYLFGKDDLAEMEKVVALIDHEEIKLYSNSLLKREIERNREAKIAEGFSSLKNLNFGQELPKYCNDYAEFDNMREFLKNASNQKKTLVGKIENDIENHSLRADKLISDLLKKSNCIDVDAELIAAAHQRMLLRDPPGKNGSIGDAVHWLSLLKKTNNGHMHIVSLDEDFASKLNTSKISNFLAEEWKQEKSFGRVFLHRSLSAFFTTKFRDVNLSSEQMKDELVERLRNSSSFAETHEIISELEKFKDFTLKQKKGLFSALINNLQVTWIAEDADVKEFYLGFKDLAWEIDYPVLLEAEKALKVKEGFFLPF